jgi:hypothetical protein
LAIVTCLPASSVMVRGNGDAGSALAAGMAVGCGAGAAVGALAAGAAVGCGAGDAAGAVEQADTRDTRSARKKTVRARKIHLLG